MTCTLLILFQLWQPYQDVYGDKIKVCFQKHLDGVVSEEAADNQALVRGINKKKVLALNF